MLIEKIQSPADVKRLSVGQMTELASEMRQLLLKKASVHGGHFGPNFGMVEATIALHYVFNSPEDKLIFDVSHQTYPHKMLTGRAFAWLDESRYDDVSGYSEPSESEHDHFIVGHTSTSVSLALGMAHGRDACGGTENVVAVIGDGSLSGGEALEGLDMAGELRSNFIVMVNDNQMSIAENHGGIYRGLKALRDSGGEVSDNLFRAMGLDYMYVPDGNDIGKLIEAFQKVRGIDHPIAVHINTLKGKGYRPAEENKEAWHFAVPFDIATGKPKFTPTGEDYGDMTARMLLREMKADPTVVAITAATPACMAMTPSRRREAGRQFIDVGIAEETAVALASGMARRGAKPVFGVFSTFVQRTYDQLSQDLCVNGSPATILVVWGSAMAMNDVTHTCLYDISLMCNIPGLVYLAPTNAEEYTAMTHWAIHQTKWPVAVRVPFGEVRHADRDVPQDYSELNRFELVHRGQRVAIVGLGNFYHLGVEAANKLKDSGIDATIINPRYITGLDHELLESLKADHELVVTLEDGQVDGGFGEKIARHYGTSSMRVINYGFRKEFRDRYDCAELLRENRLTAPQITADVMAILANA